MPREKIIDTAEQEDEELTEPLRYSITSYGADFSIKRLVKRLKKGEITLLGLQGRHVWSQARASRFVKSLLFGLPVPGIFLYREPASERLIVVDGHQRLLSLLSFYRDDFHGGQFALKGVCESLVGLKYATLCGHDRRTLNTSIIHATIFQELDSRGHKSSVFEVFERLNTTTSPLSKQEIRECIYRGSFNDLLNELNRDNAWRLIYGPVCKCARDKELILRFFALKHCENRYSRPLKYFLNRFMEENASASAEWIEKRRVEFQNVTEFAATWLPREAFRRGTAELNFAITDAILVGLSRRLDDGHISTKSTLSSIAIGLRDSQDFLSVTDRSTTDLSSVRRRIDQATKAFKVD